jgi:hypothetical protein
VHKNHKMSFRSSINCRIEWIWVIKNALRITFWRHLKLFKILKLFKNFKEKILK